MSKADSSEEHLRRIRRISVTMPETTEKLSHGELTFFVRKRVFAMFANNHHGDGHIAVWVPAAPGVQASLIHTASKTFFKPPYLGAKGWIGIDLVAIGDEELTSMIQRRLETGGPEGIEEGQ